MNTPFYYGPTQEMEQYNWIYWDLWEEGFRGRELKIRVAKVYRSIYGN